MYIVKRKQVLKFHPICALGCFYIGKGISLKSQEIWEWENAILRLQLGLNYKFKFLYHLYAHKHPFTFKSPFSIKFF